jgi:hypothetical protein
MPSGIHLRLVDNATVTRNTISGMHAPTGWSAGIFLWRSNNNNITENKFEAFGESAVGVRLRPGSHENYVHHNHYVHSDLSPYTGSAAVFLDRGTYDNSIFEMKFPPIPGVALCQLIVDLTDDETTVEYDGMNEIHHWKPCENMAAREARTTESETEFRPPSWR